MDKKNIIDLVGNESITIVDAMTKIDKNAKGILFIVDEQFHLKGCISDGDIRRWILKAGDLTALVVKAMKKQPIFVEDINACSAKEIMRQNEVNALPVVDREKKLVDIYFLYDSASKYADFSKTLKNTPVVIMAGGKGTRLYPYTKILPKPLIPIGETPIVERIINEFCRYGIKEYYMTVNYKKGMIRSYFNDLKPTYEIKYVEEDRPLGTSGSIKLINVKFDRPIFVANCDALILADYSNIYEHHLSSGNRITVISALKNIIVPYGVLHSGENGKILSMEEKPKLSYFINTGMYVIDPEIIDLIPDNEIFHMPQLIEKVMLRGGKVGMYPISEDSFLDMGEFGEMRRMEEKLHIVSN